VPLYVMNVAYPLVDRSAALLQGKRAVLVVEEGQPNFVEQNASAILRQRGVNATLHGKDMLPLAGEYNAATVLKGLRAFFERYGVLAAQAAPRKVIPVQAVATAAAESPVQPTLDDSVHARPPGFCTGCPERPIFTAMKLVERELGRTT
jgi:indolepyruvate ferredoxin oxidoreductase alpha subunit